MIAVEEKFPCKIKTEAVPYLGTAFFVVIASHLLISVLSRGYSSTSRKVLEYFLERIVVLSEEDWHLVRRHQCMYLDGNYQHEGETGSVCIIFRSRFFYYISNIKISFDDKESSFCKGIVRLVRISLPLVFPRRISA